MLDSACSTLACFFTAHTFRGRQINVAGRYIIPRGGKEIRSKKTSEKAPAVGGGGETIRANNLRRSSGEEQEVERALSRPTEGRSWRKQFCLTDVIAVEI